jgi:hypothetical protein
MDGMNEVEIIHRERLRWFQVRFIYNEVDETVLSKPKMFEEVLSIHDQIDRKILKCGRTITNQKERWHVRWGIDPPEDTPRQEYFAIRIRPDEERFEDLRFKVLKLGKQLKTEKKIKDYVYDNKTWWQTDDSWPSNCRSFEEYELFVNILQNLSLVVYNLLKLSYPRRHFFLYEETIHHLHNMLHIQDSFRPLDIGIKGKYSRALLMNFPWILFGEKIVPFFVDWDNKRDI